jgi:rRNA maturation endonuclease Nob1
MALFRCNRCKEVYEDYYPPDDTCIKCGKGTVRILADKDNIKRKEEHHANR